VIFDEGGEIKRYERVIVDHDTDSADEGGEAITTTAPLSSTPFNTLKTVLIAAKLKRHSRPRTYARRPHSRTAAAHYEADSNSVFAAPSRIPQGVSVPITKSRPSKPGSQNAQTARHTKNTTPRKAYGTAPSYEHVYSTGHYVQYNFYLLARSGTTQAMGPAPTMKSRRTRPRIPQRSRPPYESHTPRATIMTPHAVHDGAASRARTFDADRALRNHEARAQPPAHAQRRTSQSRTSESSPAAYEDHDLVQSKRDGASMQAHTFIQGRYSTFTILHTFYLPPAPTRASTPAHSLSGRVVGYQLRVPPC